MGIFNGFQNAKLQTEENVCSITADKCKHMTNGTMERNGIEIIKCIVYYGRMSLNVLFALYAISIKSKVL